MGAELGGDAIEIVVGRLVAVELAGLIVLSAVQLPDPGAFDDLDGIGQDHGALALCLALLQLEFAVRHLVLGLVAGPGELHALLEGLGLIVHEVDGALAGTQDVLGSIGGIAAGKQHGIEVLAGHIVGLDQGIGAKGGGAVLAEGADHHGGHGEEQGSLVEIIHHAQILETGHDTSLLR